MAPKETEPKDETATNMFAGTALADKLRAKGYTWVPKSKDPPKDGR
jgi:hypothetical protein